MSRQKKTRRLTDVMPTRKKDDRTSSASTVKPRAGRKLTRYELDMKAREEKRKRKHKGMVAGSRHSSGENSQHNVSIETKDPRIGSTKKVPLIVEFVNKPEKGKTIPPVKVEEKQPHLIQCMN